MSNSNASNGHQRRQNQQRHVRPSDTENSADKSRSEQQSIDHGVAEQQPKEEGKVEQSQDSAEKDRVGAVFDTQGDKGDRSQQSNEQENTEAPPPEVNAEPRNADHLRRAHRQSITSRPWSAGECDGQDRPALLRAYIESLDPFLGCSNDKNDDNYTTDK